MSNAKLPGLMKANSIGIQIEGAASEIRLHNIDCWPNRGEFKQLRGWKDRKLSLYNGDKFLLEVYCAQENLPDIFGLQFKRVVDTHVDFKSKVQNITAIFKTYDIVNAVEDMHLQTGYDS
jgi:hypothetical protein